MVSHILPKCYEIEKYTSEEPETPDIYENSVIQDSMVVYARKIWKLTVVRSKNYSLEKPLFSVLVSYKPTSLFHTIVVHF